MKFIDKPSHWIHTRPGVWHRPYSVKRNGQVKIEQKIYYEKLCERCSEKFLAVQRWRKYCTNLCGNKAIAKFGKDHRRWQNGKAFIGQGYVMLLTSRKPRKYEMEHRVIMEKYLGRKLSASEIVHHVNHDKADNRLENLMILTRKEHIKAHPACFKARGIPTT